MNSNAASTPASSMPRVRPRTRCAALPRSTTSLSCDRPPRRSRHGCVTPTPCRRALPHNACSTGCARRSARRSPQCGAVAEYPPPRDRSNFAQRAAASAALTFENDVGADEAAVVTQRDVAHDDAERLDPRLHLAIEHQNRPAIGFTDDPTFLPTDPI